MCKAASIETLMTFGKIVQRTTNCCCCCYFRNVGFQMCNFEAQICKKNNGIIVQKNVFDVVSVTD